MNLCCHYILGIERLKWKCWINNYSSKSTSESESEVSSEVNEGESEGDGEQDSHSDSHLKNMEKYQSWHDEIVCLVGEVVKELCLLAECLRGCGDIDSNMDVDM